jgi:RimJ/RimL family protein N-acetyltransferase
MRTTRSASLFGLIRPKLPLRYGLNSCYLTLNDDRYTQQIVALRNTPELGRFVHSGPLTAEAHERWLAEQLDRHDAFNFVLKVRHRFAGTVSLYNLEHGRHCELGRLMVPNDGRRFYGLAGCLLAMSFGFEVLGLPTLYCVVVAENRRVFNLAVRNGWKPDPRFDAAVVLNGRPAQLRGLSFDRKDWPAWFAERQRVMQWIVGAKNSAP